MTRLTLATLIVAGMLCSGCGREEPPEPPLLPPQPQTDDPALKSSYAEQLEQRLARLERGIDQLAAGAKDAATVTTEKLDATIVRMQALADQTKAKAQELKTASGHKWDEAKAESDRLMAKLDGAYEAAKQQWQADDAEPDAP